ncbi:MAG: protein translocase subunit SecD [Chthoniobacteraceae bacterium]
MIAPSLPIGFMTLEPWAMFTFGFALLLLFIWYFVSGSERVKRISGTVLTVVMTYLAVVSFIPPFDKFDDNGKRIVQGKIGQGIDLRGGLKFDIQLKPAVAPDGTKRDIAPDALDRAVETFRKRVDAGGIGEPVIQPQPPDRILIELPGIGPDAAQRWEDTLKKVAKLEFRMVHPDSERLLPAIEAKTAILDPAYEIVDYVHKEKGKPVTEKMIVSKQIEITGDTISGAGVGIGKMGGWEIHLAFNSAGEDLFTKVTQRMAANKQQRERFAIMLDKVVIQAAGLSDEAMASGGIYGGSAVITGDRDEDEARGVASALLNPLENPVEILSKSNTSASLGQDAIQSGIFAGKLGAILTIVLTLFYYRFAGIVANIALIIFGAMLFGAMGMFGAVLTLPGIAGILLTLGMAIDANVLIYERLREEQAAGKSLKAALEAAYEKAFSAIFDSNITTLITAGILFWQASGPVRGFAVSLVIGVIASMFSALIVTRNLFAWGVEKGLIKRITMADLIPATKFDFMGRRKIAIAGSIAIILAAIGIFALRGEKNFGVDFRGGDRLTMQARGAQPPLEKVRAVLKDIGFGDASVQIEKSALAEFLVIRDRENSAETIAAELKAKFPESKFEIGGVDKVGGLVGRELARSSIMALTLGMVGILIYVTARFELSFAVGALVALLHDVIITVGVFSLLGRELSLVIVGAILTIAGYSVNDTIVVFDRIREGIKNGRAGNITQIMNASINETLSRTILTGGITLITTIILYFFGGPVLGDFALTMLIGIVVGTYSSIFIAAPVVLWWSGRGGRDLRTELKKGDDKAVVPV